METLMSMSGSKWNFWKFAYDHGIDYKLYNIAPVETFEELENLIKEHINYAEDNFALFREEIEPRYEDSKNKYAFTWVNSKNDGSYLKYFRKCWEHRFFTFKFVNGIYCTPFKISTWTSDCDEKAVKEMFSKLYYTVTMFDISKRDYEIKLPRRWTLSFFENQEFLIQKRRRFMKNEHPHAYLTDILEKIIRVIYDQFHFTESVKGLILSPSNLIEEQWRIPHPDNRFMYCSVKTNLKEANQILIKFATTLVYILHPRFPTIFLAFLYYTEGYLQMGVYLSGQRELRRSSLPFDRVYESSNDMAFNVAYKVKEILTSCLSAEEKIHVTITNAVPSEGIDFIDRFYEFSDNGKAIFSRI